MNLRKVIFHAADNLEVGPLTETLKWGEPAYLTESTKSGSTIRLGWKKTNPEYVCVYFNCKTTIVGETRSNFGDLFEYEKDRAVLLNVTADVPDEINWCIEAALIYHRR